jgi:hypothetical protein
LSKKAKRPVKPKKGPHTQLLPQHFQGRHYRVTEFRVTPIVAIYDANGEEDNRFPAGPGKGQILSISVFPSKFKKTMVELMGENNLDMEGGKP